MQQNHMHIMYIYGVVYGLVEEQQRQEPMKIME